MSFDVIPAKRKCRAGGGLTTLSEPMDETDPAPLPPVGHRNREDADVPLADQPTARSERSAIGIKAPRTVITRPATAWASRAASTGSRPAIRAAR